MTPTRSAWLMLFARFLLFLGVQAALALVLYILGSVSAWERSADWWPINVIVADAICLALLIGLSNKEGKRFWDVFHIDQAHIKGDLLALLALTLLAAPFSYLPNVMLGGWLFGDPNATLNLFVRPLPFWAVYAAIILFPIFQGLTETPDYFGFVMPRFEASGMKKWFAISLPSLMLGLQHIAMPLLFDWRFIAWRGLMYIPFAFLTGIFLHWRPRLLPYFVVIHILMNMSFAMMFLNAAY